MDDALKSHREQIDAIDQQLLELISARAEHARAIGSLKGEGPIYRPEREAQILRRLTGLNPGPLSGEAVTAIFRTIMSGCRALEKALAVAFLGPLGTYSEEAAIKQFGGLANPVQCATIDEVFRMVETGHADYAVVPVENSTEGAIGRTLDLLVGSPLQVCGEVALPVHHNLLSKVGIDQVEVVYAHAQSLSQCHEWLHKNLPNATRQAVSSNAEAARMVDDAAMRRSHAAAIAGKRAAELFKLDILAENIEDDPRNTTRFLVVSGHAVAPSGRDRTSLAMATRNVPGAVVELLKPLAENDVSMTKLESRPSHAGLWEYVFFVDIEGHRHDDKVKRALAAMAENASFLKVLGSYPLHVG